MNRKLLVGTALLLGVVAIAYAYMVKVQRDIDSCDIDLSENEIRQLVVAKASEPGSQRYWSGRSFKPEDAVWKIIVREPKLRIDAISDYEMIKYDVTMLQGGVRFHVQIGACKNFIHVVPELVEQTGSNG